MANLFFDPCVSIGNNIWAFCDAGYLVFFDKEKCKIQYADFQNSVYQKMRTPSSNLYYSVDNIYWFSNESETICYYSLEKKLYNEICINRKSINRKGYSLAHIKNGMMYIWGFLDDGCLVFDTKTNTIVDQISINEICGIQVAAVIGIRESIYVFANDNIFTYDTDSRKIYTEKIRGFGNVKRVCKYKNDIIVLFQNGEVVRYSIENKSTEYISYIDMENEGISQMLCVNNNLYLLPWHGEKFYIINLNNYTDNETFLLDSTFLYFSDESKVYYKYNYYAEDKEAIWLSNRFGNMQICISKLDNSISLLDYVFPDSQETSVFLHKLKLKELDEKYMTLCDYLQYVYDT